MYRKKNTTIKLVALVLVLALLIGGAIGGTLAWLFTNTEPIVNTFTVGNIEITLEEETPVLSEGARKIKMVPGTKVAKNPKVTVTETSESCWLFVEVNAQNGVALESAATDNDYVTYTIASDWEQVGTTNIYGRKVESNATTKSFYILQGEGEGTLKNGYVTIRSEVTKDMMDAIKNGTASQPSLTFTAYAIQSDNLTYDNAKVESAQAAWNAYTAATTPTT